MNITKTLNGTVNPERLMEELAPLGVLGVSYLGFRQIGPGQYEAKAAREEYGHTTVDGVRTPLMADPGELEILADSDPGAALDVALAAHDWRNRSAGQMRKDRMDADRETVQSFVDSGRDEWTVGERKAIARLSIEVSR